MSLARDVVFACVYMALALAWIFLALPFLEGCEKFNGPANPKNAPWPVVCEGGGRCPIDTICVADFKCRPVPGPFGASSGDSGARDLGPDIPQQRGGW